MRNEYEEMGRRADQERERYNKEIKELMDKKQESEKQWQERLTRTQDEIVRLQAELQNKVDQNISLQNQVAKLEKDLNDKDEYFSLQYLSREEQT